MKNIPLLFISMMLVLSTSCVTLESLIEENDFAGAEEFVLSQKGIKQAEAHIEIALAYEMADDMEKMDSHIQQALDIYQEEEMDGKTIVVTAMLDSYLAASQIEKAKQFCYSQNMLSTQEGFEIYLNLLLEKGETSAFTSSIYELLDYYNTASINEHDETIAKFGTQGLDLTKASEAIHGFIDSVEFGYSYFKTLDTALENEIEIELSDDFKAAYYDLMMTISDSVINYANICQQVIMQERKLQELANNVTTIFGGSKDYGKTETEQDFLALVDRYIEINMILEVQNETLQLLDDLTEIIDLRNQLKELADAL